METQTYFSKTLTIDHPSTSESFVSQENLVGFSQVSPLMADSLSGSSSVSPMIVGETVANPRLSEASSTDDLSSLTSPTPSPSTESEPSQPMGCDQLYGLRENEFTTPGSWYSTWNPWWSRPLSPPKEASRTEDEPTGVGAGLENLDISSCFQRYEQEDAHEFLQCLLDRLESCCLDSKTKNDLSSLDDCLVKKVFGGRLVSRLCCCNCGHISNTYEPLNDLSLEIENVDSLPSALESFTKVERIEDLEAKFRCGNCKEEVSVEKQFMLDQAPSVATFHLKRFKTEGTFVEKIDKHVMFPLELDLQPYTIVNERSNEELKYQLYAVVKHSGFRPTSGHYVCYIRSSPDTWHELNDSRVTSVEEEDVLSQEAYILFYARQGIPWFSTAIKLQKPCADPGISDSSPKSVLDNIECASNPEVENSADCGANESKDVAAEGISGAPANESKFQVSKSINSGDGNPMTDASIPPASRNCSNEFDRNISTVSHLGENNFNQSIDEVANDSSFPRMPSSYHCPDECERDSSGCGPHGCLKEEKQGIHRREINRPAVDQGRIEAVRYAKRMPTVRGAKFMALLGPQTAGKMKKRTGSSPCKRVSPRRRHNHNLMRPVPVSR